MNNFIIGFIWGHLGEVDLSHVDTVAWLATSFSICAILFSFIGWLCRRAIR